MRAPNPAGREVQSRPSAIPTNLRMIFASMVLPRFEDCASKRVLNH
jgi:hypothetical protein